MTLSTSLLNMTIVQSFVQIFLWWSSLNSRMAGLPFVFLAWLDNKLYIASDGGSRIRVFADRAPFEELEETIEIEGLRSLCGMTASAATRSIFVCDRTKDSSGKYKCQRKKLSLLEASGEPSDLSITPDGDLLAEVTGMDESDSCQLNVFELANSSRTVIQLPSEIRQIFSIVQTQNQNFILFYCSRLQRRYLLSILSNDGQKFIKTVYSPTLTELCCYGFKSVRFAVKDDGQIFAIDICHNRVLLFNSDLTGCRILSIDNNDHIIFNIFSRIVYVREKQQLLLNGLELSSSQLGDLIYVFHLSPCNNINEAQQPMN